MLRKPISFSRKVKTGLGVLRNLYLISSSGLFDKSWYLAHNPDVAHANVNPMFHYLQAGGFEGRDPGPNFKSEWYLNMYKDVREAGVNPLIHFLKIGHKEGRLPRPPYNGAVNLAKSSSIYTNNRNDEPGGRKVFCIGYNKTGTTSIGHALEGLGYRLGDQSVAEQLMDDWAIRNFEPIIQYCNSADAFQDLPFSVDFTYQILDYIFPGSKFILTVRNNADEWYKSLIRFYQKIMKTDGIPTASHMKNFPYGGEGWFWRQEQNIFGIDESTVCDETIYKSHYVNHNERVLEYFRARPDDLLVLNLASPDSMRSLCRFLGIEYKGQAMPHLNKSRD